MDKIDRKLIHLLARADEIIVRHNGKQAVLGWDLRQRIVELMRSEVDFSDLRLGESKT